MQIASRFAEYGLTGGFFWLCQLCLLASSGIGAELWSRASAMQLSIPEGSSSIFTTVISSLASALAIIAVFVAGLLLDLLAAPFFRQSEMHVFKKHLHRNDSWIAPFIKQHGEYCLADYDAMRDRFGEASYWKSFKAGLDFFLFWRPERRQRYLEATEGGAFGRWRLVRPYERLWSFLSSYVVVLSGSSQLGVFTDQYYLWRTGRAISVALMIVFFEAQFSGILFSLSLRFNSFLAGLAIGALLPLALNGLAIAITLATYSRLCYTLFSLVYATREKVTSSPLAAGQRTAAN
jgi:hypothetical protein